MTKKERMYLQEGLRIRWTYPTDEVPTSKFHPVEWLCYQEFFLGGCWRQAI